MDSFTFEMARYGNGATVWKGIEIVTGLWIVAILGAIGGGASLLVDFQAAKSAPQQGAAAAYAAALAVVPYCLARAVQGLSSPRNTELRRMREVLEVQTKLLAAIANATDRGTAPAAELAEARPQADTCTDAH